MTSKNFAFPPPPPPPPPSTLSTSTSASSSQRGGASLNWRGRGRGGRGNAFAHSQARHHHPNHREGHLGYRTHQNESRSQYQGPDRTRGGPRGDFSAGLGRGQKRRHDQAFSGNQRNIDRPIPPPQVPSFGFDVNSLISATNESAPRSKQVQLPKRNLFGLAPSVDDKSSDADEDEESSMAQARPSDGSLIKVEYGGRTTSLNTPEELAAWIAERKKRFPTKAKAEEAAKKAKAEAEERTRRRAEAASQRKDKIQHQRSQPKDTNPGEISREAQKAKAKAEKLQRELQKAQRRVLELEKASQISKHTAGTAVAPEDATDSKGGLQDDDLNEVMATSSEDGSSDDSGIEAADIVDTSSSGADSGDDAPPEMSSKRSEPENARSQPRERPLCRNFARHGRCPQGRRCHFQHLPPEGGTKVGGQKAGNGQTAPRAKSLYQRLQEQQQEMTDELVLQHILYLGDHGYLDAPVASSNP